MHFVPIPGRRIFIANTEEKPRALKAVCVLACVTLPWCNGDGEQLSPLLGSGSWLLLSAMWRRWWLRRELG